MNRKLKKSLVLAVILTVFLSYFQLFQANQISTVFAEETQETNSKESLSSEDARTEISSTIENSSKSSSESVESTATSQTSGSEVASTTTSSFSTDTQPSSESNPTSTNKVEETTASSEVGPLQSPPTKSLKEDDHPSDCSIENLFYYNAFLTGNHSQSGADVEGVFAIGGNSEIYKSINYAAIREFGIGDPIADEQYVSLLLRGQMFAPLNKKVIISSTFKDNVFKGYFLYNPEKNPDIDQMVEMNGVGRNLGLPTTEEKMEEYFSELENQRNQLTNALQSIVNGKSETETDELNDIVIKSDNLYPKVFKTTEDGVYVVELPNERDKNLDLNVTDIIAKLSDVKQIIVYSADEQVVLNSLDQVGYGNVFTEVAKKFVYYFPNAKQLTNFYTKAGDFPEVYESSRNEDGTDKYNEEYFSQQSAPNSGYWLGSIIAPNATIAFHAININGYIFAKDLHGRSDNGGFEVHNFYNPFIYQITHNFNLHKTGSSNPEGIAGVDFIFLRKNKETYEYLTTEDTFQAFTADVNTITPEDIPDDAKIFTTDKNGNVSYTNTESTTIGNCGGSNTPETDYAYFFKETKAQTGYEINGTPQEVSPGETTEFVNQQALQPLPSTGGNGQGILLLFGSLLILAGGFYYRYQEL